jgi:hypothetical protein
VKDLLLGDGLVPVMSALGRHKDSARALKFPHDRQWIACETGHLDLLSRRGVYDRIAEWLQHDERSWTRLDCDRHSESVDGLGHFEPRRSNRACKRDLLHHRD